MSIKAIREVKKIKLTQGKYALVDAKNFEELNRYKWYYGGRGYAIRFSISKGKRKLIIMHRVINKTPKNKDTDHINGDKLDNRECNLRNCNEIQNQANSKITVAGTSKYRGVSFWLKHGKHPRYRASIKYKGKTYNLGDYIKEKDAAIAYNRGAKKYFGNFATCNKVGDSVC